MNKNLHFSILLDFYGSLLSPRQADIMELYYNEDLSLGEIAENIGITRQGVRAAVKKAEGILISTEESLGLAARFSEISDTIGIIKEKLKDIDSPRCGEITELIDRINI